MLEPTPERIAAARRAQSKQWSFGPKAAGEILRDPVLGEMVAHGLIAPRFVTPAQQVAGRCDFLGLTLRGEQWLTDADGEDDPT